MCKQLLLYVQQFSSKTFLLIQNEKKKAKHIFYVSKQIE